MSRVLPVHVLKKKENKQKIVMLTAYDASMGQLVDDIGADIILVGDSLGNVFAGYENTIPVTMDQMVYHVSCVSRVVKRAMVLGDMPFLSYQMSVEEACKNAGRLVKEAGAQAVKMEVGSADVDAVEAVINMGIPVVAHLGFTPQSVYQKGGYRVQGRSDEDADAMKVLAKRMEEIGCFSVLLEMVPVSLATEISEMLSIPVIGIGAGAGCDGQVLVTQDVLGMLPGKSAKFVKKYLNLYDEMKTALTTFKSEVESGTYPAEEHGFE